MGRYTSIQNLEANYAELEQHPHIVRDVYHYLSSHSKWTKQYDKFLEAVDGKGVRYLHAGRGADLQR